MDFPGYSSLRDRIWRPGYESASCKKHIGIGTSKTTDYRKED
jgi:hypothetical protein